MGSFVPFFTKHQKYVPFLRKSFILQFHIGSFTRRPNTKQQQLRGGELTTTGLLQLDKLLQLFLQVLQIIIQ